MIDVCIWPCGTWCLPCDVEEYLLYMSDDFERRSLTEDDYQEFEEV